MKNKRQEAIISIISEQAVETQEELAALLNERGFNTTQATISRDIRELKLTKISYDGNRHRYVAENTKENSDSYRHVMMNGIVSMDHSENIIVIKTVSGMAMAVGAAIDALCIDGIMGCIAGDDTLFLAIKKKERAAGIMSEIAAVKNVNS
jgi:transcriptional regulator of arginine metabolism